MDYYLMRQYDTEFADGSTRHEGFAAYPVMESRKTYYDPSVDFIVYVAM